MELIRAFELMQNEDFLISEFMEVYGIQTFDLKLVMTMNREPSTRTPLETAYEEAL